MGQNTVAIKMKNINKSFFGVEANKDVNIKIFKGKINALLGENGAGKTTLMNILAGKYRANSGQIFISGKEVIIKSPKDAISLGIGMVHQHFNLIEPLTVVENIVLGHSNPRIFISPKKLKKQIEDLSCKYNLYVNPIAKIYNLSVGEQQKVEILKSLFRKVDILILDEPTAVLNPLEVCEFFKILKNITAEGKTIIFITHKLEEVLEVADTITIMRKGQVIETLDINNATTDILANLMIGRKLSNTVVSEISQAQADQKLILKVDKISTQKKFYGCPLNNVSFSLNKGELMGIAGVARNGQRELTEVLVGLTKVKSGSILVDNVNMTNLSPHVFIEEGLAYIPEDRLGEGLLPNLNLVENFLLRNHFMNEYRTRFGFLRKNKAKKVVEKIIKKYNIKVPKLEYPVKFLSGGNLQRFIIGRELELDPKIMVAVNSTRGLDIAGVEMVYKIMLEQAMEKQIGIIIISEDLDELLKNCHSLAVMFKGQISQKFPCNQIKPTQIGKLMGGVGFCNEVEE